MEPWDEIKETLRKQGRAAIAAQAAAESCLSVLERMPAAAEGRHGAVDAEALLRTLLPFIDAFRRLTKEVDALSAPGALPWWVRRPPVLNLLSGIKVLEGQLDAALVAANIELIDQVGISVDPDAHRVVATRAGAPGDVLEIVRVGYRSGKTVLREADVIAAAET